MPSWSPHPCLCPHRGYRRRASSSGSSPPAAQSRRAQRCAKRRRTHGTPPRRRHRGRGPPWPGDIPPRGPGGGTGRRPTAMLLPPPRTGRPRQAAPPTRVRRPGSFPTWSGATARGGWSRRARSCSTSHRAWPPWRSGRWNPTPPGPAAPRRCRPGSPGRRRCGRCARGPRPWRRRHGCPRATGIRRRVAGQWPGAQWCQSWHHPRHRGTVPFCAEPGLGCAQNSAGNVGRGRARPIG